MPEPTAHPSDEKLSDYNRGLLSLDEAVAIETHISDCAPCCETIVSLSSDDTFVGLLKEARQISIDQTLAHGGQVARPASFPGDVPPELAEHPRYEIVRLIGKGGMGDVYEATHRKMERRVALKVINRQLFQKAEAVNRFHREVKTAAQLSHPNIVTAFDADQADDCHFMVMEFVDGVDLSQIVKDEGALPVADACDHIRQAATGLQHAHERGMVHRDIKPHNLMVTADGIIKILDFGLASLAPEAIPGSDAVAASSHLTAAGAIMGTPDFISPEQAEDARSADIRSDIYSLGATLYFLLSGQVPFDDGSVMHKLKSHAQVEPKSLASLRDDVPEELVSIVSRMMAKDPDERYLTPNEVAQALESFLRTYRPDEAESPGHVSSSGGNMSGSDGQASGAGDIGPDWIPVLGKWLFYLSLIPIALLILDMFFWSDGASNAPDRTMFFIGTSIAMSTIGGILAGVHQFKTGHRDRHGENGGSEGQNMLIGLILLGAGAFYLFETDHGVVHVAVNDPSLEVSIVGQTIAMEDGGEKPLTVTPGEWPLLVRKKDAGFQFHTDSFKIRRGDEINFKVEVDDDEIVVLKDGEPFERQEIFDLRRELQDTDARVPSDGQTSRTASTSTRNPELKLNGRSTNGGNGGIPKVHTWNFSGRDVGDLKVRLLLARNGKSEVVQEFDFEELPEEFSSEVRLQFKDSATGSDRKRRVNAILYVESPVNSRSTTIDEDEGLSFSIEAPFMNTIERADLAPIEPDRTELLLTRSYWKGDMSHGRSMESMTEATKGGNAAFLFVTLDWSPASPDEPSGKGLEKQIDADRKDIRGTWQVTYSEDSGRIAPQKMLKELRFVIDEQNLTTEIGGRKSVSMYKLDPSSSPKSIDLTESGRTKQGIYDLVGDTLRICIAESGKQRPTAFDSQPGSANDLIIMLKRIHAPAKVDLPTQAISPDATSLTWVDVRAVTREKADQALDSIITAASPEKQQRAQELIDPLRTQAQAGFAALEKGVEAGVEMFVSAEQPSPYVEAGDEFGDVDDPDALLEQISEAERGQLFLRMRPGTTPEAAIATMVATYMAEAGIEPDSPETLAWKKIQATEFVDIGDGWFAATGENMLPLPPKQRALDVTPFVKAFENHHGAPIRFVWLMDDTTRSEIDQTRPEADAILFGGLITTLRDMQSTTGGVWLGRRPKLVLDMQFANQEGAQKFKVALEELAGFIGLLSPFGSDDSDTPDEAQEMRKLPAAISLLLLDRDGAHLSKTFDIGLLERLAAAGLPWPNLFEPGEAEEEGGNEDKKAVDHVEFRNGYAPGQVEPIENGHIYHLADGVLIKQKKGQSVLYYLVEDSVDKYELTDLGLKFKTKGENAGSYFLPPAPEGFVAAWITLLADEGPEGTRFIIGEVKVAEFTANLRDSTKVLDLYRLRN